MEWKSIKTFREIRLEETEGIAKITINRPEVRNAFTPTTTRELSEAFTIVRELSRIRVVLLTGAETPHLEGESREEWLRKQAFCSGGDMHVKGRGGYIDEEGTPRLSVLDVQMLCDLTIASVNARFGQTGPKVGSFDAGFGSAYLARIVGQKKAREIWFMCRQYSAEEAERMGLVNKVVRYEDLEPECVRWAHRMMELSPLALRMIKMGLNAELDGQAGIQQLAGDCTALYYMLDEAQEGGRAFLEKRRPHWEDFPLVP